MSAAPAPAAWSTASWLARDHAALAGVLPRYYDVVAARGEGSWLVDVEGRRYLDLGAGIAVNSTGHCHPAVVRAVQEQAATLLHTSVVVHHQRNIELAERLGALVPWMPSPQVFFSNSGTEAVDGALKLARRTTGRPAVIAFERAFHGRTLAATTLTTAKAKYRDGYEPLLPAVHHAPYCVPLDHPDEATAVERALDGFDAAVAAAGGASQVGCVIVEPVLGEGGYVVPPRAWLAALRERCDAAGALLVFDEVQTGVGRTGCGFAAETFGVHPDVVLFAKGIASGLPLGGLIAERALFDRWPTGTHGSTFGGNPVACAAALATLDVLEGERCFERARLLGARVLERLRVETAAMAHVVEVRGVGLMIGVQLAGKAAAAAVTARCLDEGVIVLACGPGEDVLRLIPPLTITEADLDHGIHVVVEAIRRVPSAA